jgi:hypothetical protein
MSKLERLSVVALLTLAVSLSPFASPAGAGDEEPAMSEEMQQEMMAWMKLAQPGPQHEGLAKYVGSWAGEVTMWMAPGMEPMVETSKAEAKMILGGRFLEFTHKGSYGGMPFEGRAIEAYSHLDKRYESIWIDNFGTLILFFTGSASADGSQREMKTSFSDPVEGGTFFYRTVFEWQDDNHFTYTTYMEKGDGEFKNMVIKFTRQ